MKSLSSVVAIIMVLVITIALVGILYTWITTTVGSTAKTGTQVTSKLKEDLTTCMRIDSVSGNRIYLRNCGSGKIYNQSLTVFLDGEQIPHSLPSDIDPGKTGAVKVYGLWKYSLGSHTLKVTLGQLSVQRSVELAPNPSAVAVYTFETLTRDNVTYDSVGDNDGILYTGGEPALSKVVPGKFGNALEFDGVDDVVKAPKNILAGRKTSFTLAAWIKRKTPVPGTNDISEYDGIVTESGFNNLVWRIESIDRLMLYIKFKDGTVTGELESDLAKITDDNWHMVVTTFDSSTGTVTHYIDGEARVSWTNSNWANKEINDYPYHFFIGWPNQFNGTIDNVMIFDRALDPDEVIVFSD